MNVFDKMNEILRTKGWIQGKYEADTGEVCLLGALMKSNVDFRTYSEACKYLTTIANDLYPNPVRPWLSPIYFNDYQGRTKAEVMHVVHHAADSWERNNKEENGKDSAVN